jgi:hypothetical protein
VRGARDSVTRRRLSFYRRLSAAQKREYDRSDARSTLPLAPSPALAEAAAAVVTAIASESPAKVRRAAQRLVDEVCTRLSARSARRGPPPPRVKVLRVRPRTARSEFHGLYTRSESGESEIKVWMFTAAHARPVKARTFLRTLLHEVCHHVDMTLLDLPNSLHTLGFHARESSLLRSLERSGADIPGGRTAPRVSPRTVRQPRAQESRLAVQLDLFNSARSSNARPRGRAD